MSEREMLPGETVTTLSPRPGSEGASCVSAVTTVPDCRGALEDTGLTALGVIFGTLLFCSLIEVVSPKGCRGPTNKGSAPTLVGAIQLLRVPPFDCSRRAEDYYRSRCRKGTAR